MKAKELLDTLKKQRLTQTKAAQILGVSRITVNQWCNGKKKISPAQELKIRATWKQEYIIGAGHLINLIARLKMNETSFANYYGTTKKNVKYWTSGKEPLPQALQDLILIHPKMKQRRKS